MENSFRTRQEAPNVPITVHYAVVRQDEKTTLASGRPIWAAVFSRGSSPVRFSSRRRGPLRAARPVAQRPRQHPRQRPRLRRRNRPRGVPPDRLDRQNPSPSRSVNVSPRRCCRRASVDCSPSPSRRSSSFRRFR